MEKYREEDFQIEATVLEAAIIRVTTWKDLGKSHIGQVQVFSECDKNFPPRSFTFLTVPLISVVSLEMSASFFFFIVKVEKTLNFPFLIFSVQQYQLRDCVSYMFAFVRYS